MQALAASTRETVVLTVPRGLRAVCLERVESPEALRLSFTTGVELPIERGASAKVLLAFLDKPVQSTIVECLAQRQAALERETLLDELARIRAQGYAVTAEELDRGARAVAAPVYADGRVMVAGTELAGPLFRLDEARLSSLIAAVMAGAREIGTRLSTAAPQREAVQAG